MVVAIIVAILASVAIPLMGGYRRRAMVTEAESALGAIRSAMRANFAQTGNYSVDPDGGDIDVLADLPGITPATDLDGRLFLSLRTIHLSHHLQPLLIKLELLVQQVQM